MHAERAKAPKPRICVLSKGAGELIIDSETAAQRKSLKIHVESRIEKVNCSPRKAKGVADSRFFF